MAAPILVVEDDVELGEVIQEVLGMITNDEVEWIQDGQEALDRLQNISPGVVILDLHMPHVSGLEVLAFIRQDERLANTKVVVITADALRAKKAEEVADLVLLKPIRYTDLSQLMQRIVQ
jgi:CheY-like chemotaxis protein